MNAARIAEVVRHVPRDLGDALAVLRDLASDERLVVRRPVTMGVQLDVDAGGGDVSRLVGRHHVHQPALLELRQVEPDFVGEVAQHPVLVGGRQRSFVGEVAADRVAHALAVRVVTEADAFEARYGRERSAEATALPQHVRRGDARHRLVVLRVIRRQIHSRRYVVGAQDRQGQSVKVYVPVVERDRDGAVGQRPRAQPLDGFLERQHVEIVRPEKPHPGREMFGGHEERWIPEMLVLLRDAVIAEDEKAFLPPARSAGHLEDTGAAHGRQSGLLDGANHW